MNMKKEYAFEFVRRDEFQNTWVHCPVCGWTHKLDGIRKHIISKAKAGDARHAKWLRDHLWRQRMSKHGRRTIAYAKARYPQQKRDENG